MSDILEEERFGKTLETMASIDNVFGDFGD